jgi:hypothetical protein
MANISIVDLKQLKEVLDNGFLTEEEFNNLIPKLLSISNNDNWFYLTVDDKNLELAKQKALEEAENPSKNIILSKQFFKDSVEVENGLVSIGDFRVIIIFFPDQNFQEDPWNYVIEQIEIDPISFLNKYENNSDFRNSVNVAYLQNKSVNKEKLTNSRIKYFGPRGQATAFSANSRWEENGEVPIRSRSEFDKLNSKYTYIDPVTNQEKTIPIVLSFAADTEEGKALKRIGTLISRSDSDLPTSVKLIKTPKQINEETNQINNTKNNLQNETKILNSIIK